MPVLEKEMMSLGDPGANGSGGARQINSMISSFIICSCWLASHGEAMGMGSSWAHPETSRYPPNQWDVVHVAVVFLRSWGDMPHGGAIEPLAGITG